MIHYRIYRMEAACGNKKEPMTATPKKVTCPKCQEYLEKK